MTWTPEIQERAKALIEEMAPQASGKSFTLTREHYCEAAAILDLLDPPVDPDLIEARNLAAARCHGTATAEAILAGEFDELYVVSCILVGFKRARELAREDVRAAVEAEREACAKEAEKGGWMGAIAFRIRNRSRP